jgi:hypothetical protein
VAYALHNEALAVVEGGTFDCDIATEKLRAVEQMFESWLSKEPTS